MNLNNERIYILVCFLMATPSSAETGLSLKLDADGQEIARLAVEAVPLSDILEKISQSSGFQLHVLGDLSIPVTIEFANVKLPEALRRLSGKQSIAIVYHPVVSPEGIKNDQTVAEVWVFGSNQSAAVETPHLSQRAPEPRVEEAVAGLNDDMSNQDFRHSLETEGDDSVAQWVNMMVDARDITIRQQVITELERIGSETAVAAIGVALGDQSVTVRQHAVTSLSNVGSDLSIRLMGQALFGDSNPLVRMTAIQTLSKRQDEISRAFINSATDDKDPRVQSLAREKLSIIK